LLEKHLAAINNGFTIGFRDGHASIVVAIKEESVLGMKHIVNPSLAQAPSPVQTEDIADRNNTQASFIAWRNKKTRCMSEMLPGIYRRTIRVGADASTKSCKLGETIFM
jgi:hypothetical protein